MNSVDTRPTAFRRVGDRITLQWEYPASEIPKMQEYRIYRADRMQRNFQKVASVPIDVLEYSVDMMEPGDFVLTIKAFSGAEESSPSNEVLVQVIPGQVILDSAQIPMPHSVRRFLGSPNLKEVAKQLGYEEECDVWPGSRNPFRDPG